MSSNSLKGLPKEDEDRDVSSAASDYSDELTASKAPMKPMQSPRTPTKFALSPQGNHSQIHRENSADSDSFENRQSSPFRLRKTSKQDHTDAHEDAPSVSSGYNSDDVNSHLGDAAALTSPRASRKTAGQDYDPKQYQDSQSDFHPVRKRHCCIKVLNVFFHNFPHSFSFFLPSFFIPFPPLPKSRLA